MSDDQKMDRNVCCLETALTVSNEQEMDAGWMLYGDCSNLWPIVQEYWLHSAYK